MTTATVLINALITLLGKEKVLFEEKRCRVYASDASSLSAPSPIAVVFPETENDVEHLIGFANETHCAIVPRGAGTGTTGGALPTESSIVLSFERMDQILSFDQRNRIITVQPGVITGDIVNVVEKEGLFYPPDPASLAECTIGGNVAENAGGPRALKYGVTKDYVMGLKGYFGNGSAFNFGGKQYKNVAGYNLQDVLVGSEGTLGIITQIQLRLCMRPRVQKDVAVSFLHMEDAIETLIACRQSHIEPSCAELIDPLCLTAVCDYLNVKMPFSEGHAVVLFQVDGNHPSMVQEMIETITKISKKHHAQSVMIAHDQKDSDALWKIRRNVSYALKAMTDKKISEDIVVPPTEISTYMSFLRQLNDTYTVTILGYGHLGDGNIHVNVLKRGCPDEEWTTVLPRIRQAIFEKAVALGGSITGEHGIGLSKKAYMGLMFSPEELEIMRQIKHVFDPNGILNPGKLI